MKVHVFRLKPGQLLKEDIDSYVKAKKIKAGIILTCVGNLKNATLRMADSVTFKNFNDAGTYEIVSLVGTVEIGNSHLHISLSDKNGNVFGGHLKGGAVIGVTAEVAIGELENIEFERKFDKKTGYKELKVKQKNSL